ncbi:MAG: radical SAM family heme chaperone HemW [Fimbriimonadaceae bacterium]|nr:radical SAM family heme chaperone HemW [Fimbriimonadaceae bacterium]QYK56129.1 MAG: radical SAM family heme chaperone HemW [Fimbriimonadaceae bacterium]
MSEPVAIYVHIPFCPSKCGYCDFNSFALSGEIVPRTVDAIVAEVAGSPHRGRPAKTVFFGGGTPTFIEASQLARILDAVREAHPFAPDCEITSEANPGTVDAGKFAAMRQAGFNRISLGAQSFDTSDLVQLGRVHEPGHVGRAVHAARQAGFENLNLDLMFALPGQSLRGWRRNLELALAMAPEHLSLYCLTIEPNTRFYRYQLRGMLDLPDEDRQVAMYEEAVAACEEAGLAQYEISNFARPGRECRHNLAYWRAEEYVGYGPGAVGRVGSLRQTNTKHPAAYCERVETRQPLACEEESVDDPTLRLERLMLGLRLNSGLETAPLGLRPKALERVLAAGWGELSEGRLRLTPKGRLLHNEVVATLA